MSGVDSLEMLAFNLKMVGRKTKKNVLISAGGAVHKELLFPVLKKLAEQDFTLFATPGTSRFLNDRDVENQIIHKIADRESPNIHSYLEQNRFDLVINVLTGDHDYDESSDCNLIRTLCIENAIPLITEPKLGVVAIENLLKHREQGKYEYKVANPDEPWNLKREFLRLVAGYGGFASHHAHYDKAYLISTENLKLGQVDMQHKWTLYKYLKESYTHDDLVERMCRCVDNAINQGVTHTRTFVDADDTVKLMPMKAALAVKERYLGQINMEIAVQPLQGVLDPASRKHYAMACELADVVGGLPSKDRPTPEKHLDYILNLAKDLGKPVDVHIDQENNPDENETELLALKAIEHGMEGRVRGVHAISLAAKFPREQDRICKIVKDAGMQIVICPSAALSMKAHDKAAPIHNSIGPVVRLLDHGIDLCMGIDNIADLFMPIVDGDMWFECRAMMETTRFYDLDAVARMASNKNGFGI